MKQFFRDKDGLGHTPAMTYKSRESHGTTIGGCVSVCATAAIWAYIGIILGAFFFMESSYGQTTVDLILPLDDTPVYEMTAIDIIPAYQVKTTLNDVVSWNDASLWKMEFIESDTSPDQGSAFMEPVTAIPCDEYI